MAPWKLPLIVAALALPIAAGFLVGGPGIGVAVGALVAVSVVVVAARQKPRGPIGHAGVAGGRRVLVVIVSPAEDPAAAARIARAARLGDGTGEAEVLVLAPARIGFLDRWASDVEGAREAAQRSLVATVAELAKAGVEAEARVGDEDVVQAVEDQLGSFDASEVVLVSGEAEAEEVAAAAAELRARLEPDFRRVTLGDGG